MNMQMDEAYRSAVREIMAHCDMKKERSYIQHQKVTCLEHSICVSYLSYRMGKRLNLDAVALARGALLHDFFLYDWHDKENRPRELHGPNHPRVALRNANKRFLLNDKEQDIILKHMWPLTITLPKYKETWVIVLADKICTISEVCHWAEIKKFAAEILT